MERVSRKNKIITFFATIIALILVLILSFGTFKFFKEGMPNTLATTTVGLNYT